MYMYRYRQAIGQFRGDVAYTEVDSKCIIRCSYLQLFCLERIDVLTTCIKMCVKESVLKCLKKVKMCAHPRLLVFQVVEIKFWTEFHLTSICTPPLGCIVSFSPKLLFSPSDK